MSAQYGFDPEFYKKVSQMKDWVKSAKSIFIIYIIQLSLLSTFILTINLSLTSILYISYNLYKLSIILFIIYYFTPCRNSSQQERTEIVIWLMNTLLQIFAG
jgi:hypothetical protein